jgi:GDP-L-fucose synthase
MTAENLNEKVYVAGRRGIVGSAIVRILLSQGVPRNCILTRTRAELDLCNQAAVKDFFQGKAYASLSVSS